MAHLTDMEELLASIKSPLMKDYMQEAMNCYMAGAYRGCIVLSYIALFDDLLDKLDHLGNVNSVAKKIYIEASKKKSDQQIFESYLIDELASKSLLSGLDTTFLGILRTIRNKSAHPSGHKPSPEEARFIFFEAINRFLAKPILSTTQLVDEIISRLANTNFFPTAIVCDFSDIVSEEIASLHDAAIPQLINKLADATTSSDKVVTDNATRFIIGLALLQKENIKHELLKRIIKKKSDVQQYAKLILKLITAEGTLIVDLENTYIKRIKKILADRIEEVKASERETLFAHPISVIVSLIKNLPPEQMASNFYNETVLLIEKQPYSKNLLDAIRGHEDLLKEYINNLLKNACSSTFDTANDFALAIEDLDSTFAFVIDEKQAFQFIVAIIRAANHGAYDSKNLVRIKFSTIPNIRDLAIKYTESNKKAAREYFQDELALDLKLSEFVDKYMQQDGDA